MPDEAIVIVETPEDEAFRLRKEVYGDNIPHDRWQTIKHNWLADIAWLRRQAEKERTKNGQDSNGGTK